jgi:hypothetical protein
LAAFSIEGSDAIHVNPTVPDFLCIPHQVRPVVFNEVQWCGSRA